MININHNEKVVRQAYMFLVSYCSQMKAHEISMKELHAINYDKNV